MSNPRTPPHGPPGRPVPAHRAPTRKARSLTLVVTTLLALVVGLLGAPPSAEAATAQNAYEQDIVERTNQARAAAGLRPLSTAPGLTDLARNWANDMRRKNRLSHNANLGDGLGYYGAPEWRSAAENIGLGGSSSRVFAAYMASPGHRANLLRADVGQVGVGAVQGPDGRVWDVMVFTDSYDAGRYGPARTRPGVVPVDGSDTSGDGGGTFFLARSLTELANPARIAFGQDGDTNLVCDWDGNGTDTIGLFREGRWLLRNANSTGAPQASFTFGNRTDQPVCGDWNRDGRDTVGVYRDGRVFLRNANSAGAPDGDFFFGGRGDTAVAGDWNGDGYDSIGVQRSNGRFYLTDSNTRPRADYDVAYGSGSDRPVAGDWNGDGRTTIGAFRGGTWYLTDSNTRPTANRVLRFGGAGDRPLAGHWNVGRSDTIGVGR